MGTLGGFALRALALILCVRVTSWWRSRAENADTTGSIPDSAHLTGAAIDYGKETPRWKTNIIMAVATGGYTEQGTAPHYHVEPRGWLGWIILVCLILIVRGRGRR